MRVLRRQRPSPEQINIVRRIQQGASLIRGAAGSGKTSTALMALRASTGAVVNQFRNEGRLPAHVLVLTYYNSLAGYVAAVAQDELADYAEDIHLRITTFDKWAYSTLGWRGAMPIAAATSKLRSLARPLPRDTGFIEDEVNYLLGRFPPDQLASYLIAPRAGRGRLPQMDQVMRQRLLAEVVHPYIQWKRDNGFNDFHDLAWAMATSVPPALFDVLVVDEAQDLSANQLRAIVRHCADDATIAIVTDSTQRIYPRGTTWVEAGLTIPANRSFRLETNYRNTREIAALAASMAAGVPTDDDGSLPDPDLCSRSGPKPKLLHGRFPAQLAHAIAALADIDLEAETVGFLHLKGGGWFRDVRIELAHAGYDFCELQGATEWPEDSSNIGLCTLHSAKGLEFDHVIILGLSQELASHGDEEEDDRYLALRRLLAMAIGRARETVTIGADPASELGALSVLDPATYEEVIL